MSDTFHKQCNQLQKLLHNAMQKSILSGVMIVSAAHQQKSEVENRLQRAIAQLMHEAEPNQEIINHIRGDVMLCATVGWITSDIVEQAQTIIDNIEQF